MGRWARLVLGISPARMTPARLGFRCDDPRTTARLAAICACFLEGYNTALSEWRPERLAEGLDGVHPETRGFAYEGAAMGIALQDMLLPGRRRRLREFLEGPGETHAYMVLVGMGWALARLRRRVAGVPAGQDPLLGWLCIDGYGFHEGFFRPRRSFAARRVPDRVTGHARRVFDQGLGRSLWFVEGGAPVAIADRIRAFPEERRADLWSGIGLAACYAGGVERKSLETLVALAGAHSSSVAQGAAFAAKTRTKAGNATPETERACAVLCRTSVVEAARATDAARERLGAVTPDSYQGWRDALRREFGLRLAAREDPS